MDLGIRGKVALVTAASKGLGRGSAEALSAEGCRVAICARTAADVDGPTAQLRLLAGRLGVVRRQRGEDLGGRQAAGQLAQR